ncbi:hypothetical protein D3C76_1535060 [compost metagenome]
MCRKSVTSSSSRSGERAPLMMIEREYLRSSASSSRVRLRPVYTMTGGNEQISSVDMRLSKSLPSMSGNLRSMIMQSKIVVRSKSSASWAKPTAVISMSSSPISREMLSR